MDGDEDVSFVQRTPRVVDGLRYSLHARGDARGFVGVHFAGKFCGEFIRVST